MKLEPATLWSRVKCSTNFDPKSNALPTLIPSPMLYQLSHWAPLLHNTFMLWRRWTCGREDKLIWIMQKRVTLLVYRAHNTAAADVIFFLDFQRKQDITFHVNCLPADSSPEISSLIWAATWDFKRCGMCDQQRLRPACAYAQSDQSLC